MSVEIRIRGRQQNHRRAAPRHRCPPVDEAAVERAVSGDLTVLLTPVERDAALDWVDRPGVSASEVARRLGVSTRTVTRRRAARRAD